MERVAGGHLDVDMPYGTGTDDILAHLDLGYVRYHTAGAHWQETSDGEVFLADIDGIMEDMVDCDLILYQAGADPHVDDPLGGFLISDHLLERDRRLFAAVLARNLPVAWNQAGGCQRVASGGIRPVLDIHDNTLRACWEESCAPL